MKETVSILIKFHYNDSKDQAPDHAYLRLDFQLPMAVDIATLVKQVSRVFTQHKAAKHSIVYAGPLEADPSEWTLDHLVDHRIDPWVRPLITAVEVTS